MNENNPDELSQKLSAEGTPVLPKSRIPQDKLKANRLRYQEWVRDFRKEKLSSVYYHVTPKCRRELILREGLRPATAETKQTPESFDTIGKTHVCEKLTGDCCSAERWIGELK
jgi:hypothetical protein